MDATIYRNMNIYVAYVVWRLSLLRAMVRVTGWRLSLLRAMVHVTGETKVDNI